MVLKQHVVAQQDSKVIIM